MYKVLTIFGTRPEAIKLAPVLLELQRRTGRVCSRVCVTAQHRQMLDQVLGLFGIVPDVDLDLMAPDQRLSDLTALTVQRLDKVLQVEAPELVMVQGDTTTVMAAALVAFYHKVPVGHVEAGLRSFRRYSPFPEEMNRRITTALTTYHFAPTQGARRALLEEGVGEGSIYVTGNTVIDALRIILKRDTPPRAREILHLAGVGPGLSSRQLVLVTAHRRENQGEGLAHICRGLSMLVERNPEVVVVYPVHLNPHVQEPVYRLLSGVERVILTEPLEYDTFSHLMSACTLVLTDSGGIQEEAPSLGKPVLVLRSETERPEAVQAGTALLVGPDADRIVHETERLLHDPVAYERMARMANPYGDGRAAVRIAAILFGDEGASPTPEERPVP